MGKIASETVERILEATDIVDLISGYIPLKRQGSGYLALCPFHNEKTPSLNVNPQRSFFHCFGCQTSGTAINFVQYYENVSWPEAARKLAERAGIPIQEEVLDAREIARRDARSKMMKLQRQAAEYFNRMLFKSPNAQAARQYLTSRGFTMEVSRDWQFGYAPEQQNLFFTWARDAGYTIQDLVEGGLAKWRDEERKNQGAYAFFRHRLMFPICNAYGEPIAFSGRVLSPDQRGGKYINSPETAIFNKSKNVFGLHKTKRPILQSKQAVISEGQLDLISAYAAGVQNLVAPLGTAFTEDHARLLKRHTDEVVLCYDSDQAGMKAARKSFRTLAPFGFHIRLAQLPPGEDPDSLIRSQGPEAFEKVVASAPEFFEFQIDRQESALNQGSLRDRLAFARDLTLDLSLVDDKMMQDSLIMRISTRLGVGDEELRKHLSTAIRNRAKMEQNQKRREAAQRQRVKEGREPASGPAEAAAPEPATANAPRQIENFTLRLLCHCFLTDDATKANYQEKPTPSFLREVPESDLLAMLWSADFTPSQPASVQAFVSQLAPDDQAKINNLLANPLTRNAPTQQLVDESLEKLRIDTIKSRIHAVEVQLNAPESKQPERVAQLSQQLLELNEQLRDPK